MTTNKIYKIAFTLFISFSLIFLSGRLLISYGVMKEREAKVCAAPNELKQYKETIDMAAGICASVGSDRNAELEKCHNEVDLWKERYIFLKNKPVPVSPVATPAIK